MIVVGAPQGSPLAAALNPESAATTEALFLRQMEHSLRWLCWSKTKDAQHGRGVPEPVLFPWEAPAAGEDVGYVGDSMTGEQAADWLGWGDAIAAENERRRAAGEPLIPT